MKEETLLQETQKRSGYFFLFVKKKKNCIFMQY